MVEGISMYYLGYLRETPYARISVMNMERSLSSLSRNISHGVGVVRNFCN